MLTLYTAVGSLKFERTNGKPVPYIINNEKEYGMSKEELLVWSCLAFQILTYPELEQVVERNCADSGQPLSLPLSHYLNRLLLRGASGKRNGGKRRGRPVPSSGNADHHAGRGPVPPPAWKRPAALFERAGAV